MNAVDAQETLICYSSLMLLSLGQTRAGRAANKTSQ